MVGERRMPRRGPGQLHRTIGKGDAAMDELASDGPRRTDRGSTRVSALAGKVAVITGASRGIGRATADRLARDGASVVINYAVSDEQAKAVVKEIEARGGKAIAIQAGIARLDDIARLFRETVVRLGRLDILVARRRSSNSAARSRGRLRRAESLSTSP